jgi:hypothetical protein
MLAKQVGATTELDLDKLDEQAEREVSKRVKTEHSGQSSQDAALN